MRTRQPSDHAVSRLPHAIVAVATVASAGIVGSLATLPNIPIWYSTLTKPWFTPPNGVFGPAWTVLYVLMAVAFYRILRHPQSRDRSSAIAIFVAHMLLNALWSVAFFGNHSPALGLADFALLWPMALAAVLLFWRLDHVAGALMIPNLGWVTFAAILNIAIWRLN